MSFELLEYVDERGVSPFGRWFDDLDPTAAARVTIGLARLSDGNRSNVKGVGDGVHELKADFGPGYRIYFGIDGPTVLLLLAGGTKKRQQQDIAVAKANWQAFRRRKRQAG